MVVSRDVMRHVSALKRQMYAVTGEVVGKTFLALPASTEQIEEAMSEYERWVTKQGPNHSCWKSITTPLRYSTDKIDLKLIHAFESVIIDWLSQVRDVTSKDSAQPIIDGFHPRPDVEVEFWKAKARNLESIYEQLQDDKVRKMAEFLESSRSTYFQTFKDMFADVVAGA